MLVSGVILALSVCCLKSPTGGPPRHWLRTCTCLTPPLYVDVCDPDEDAYSDDALMTSQGFPGHPVTSHDRASSPSCHTSIQHYSDI